MDMTSVTYLASFEVNGIPLMTIPVRGAIKEPGEAIEVFGQSVTVQSVTWCERDGLLVCVMAVSLTTASHGLSAAEIDELCDRLGRD